MRPSLSLRSLRSVTMRSALTALLSLTACGSSSKEPSTSPAPDAGQPDTGPQLDPTDWVDGLEANQSCILACPTPCNEANDPWKCPALAAWSTFPHDPTACGNFDGGYPTPVAGKCTVSAPSGQAVEKTNTAGTPIAVKDLPFAIAITPDGSTAYVLNTDNGVGTTQASLSPINITTNTAGKPIDVGPGPSALAIAP